MGNGSYYGLTGRETYRSDGTRVADSKGNEGWVVVEIGDTKYHSSLPQWSKTSRIYFKRNDRGLHGIEQMRIFENRRAFRDFDWGHTHREFQKGTVHVHEWRMDGNGKWSRSPNPRRMTNSEIEQFEELIHLADPTAKIIP